MTQFQMSLLYAHLRLTQLQLLFRKGQTMRHNSIQWFSFVDLFFITNWNRCSISCCSQSRIGFGRYYCSVFCLVAFTRICSRWIKITHDFEEASSNIAPGFKNLEWGSKSHYGQKCSLFLLHQLMKIIRWMEYSWIAGALENWYHYL